MQKLRRVISGFQTGADIAGVRAAKDCGLETGGYIPKGFKTLDGSKPQYKSLYGAVEHSSSNYRDRTWDNIQQADATIRFASNWNSAGEKCTLNGIKNWGKPFHDLTLMKEGYLAIWGPRYTLTNFRDIILYTKDWLDVNGVTILNVAGNSEQTSPGIEKAVYEFLIRVF